LGASTRLLSIDVFRGLTMAAMVLVENPGDWNHTYHQLHHARWGMPITFTDWILPFFLFIVGLSVPFALDKRRAAGISDSALIGKILRRSGILFGLGLLLYLYPHFRFERMRIPGVLQAIAVVYLICALLYLKTSWRVQAALVPAIVMGNWLLLTRVPVPGIGPPNLRPDTNLAAWLDSTLLGGHLRNPGSDPEGLLTTLSAVGTCLLGVLAARWMRGRRRESLKVGGLAAAGFVLAATGRLWSVAFPMIKDLWTGSYMMHTAGLALLFFALLYWLIDSKRLRGWEFPFAAYGASCIAVYLASQLTYITLFAVLRFPAAGNRVVSLLEVIQRGLFRPWLSPAAASLAFALCTVVFWGIPLGILYRKKIHIRI